MLFLTIGDSENDQNPTKFVFVQITDEFVEYRVLDADPALDQQLYLVQKSDFSEVYRRLRTLHDGLLSLHQAIPILTVKGMQAK